MLPDAPTDVGCRSLLRGTSPSAVSATPETDGERMQVPNALVSPDLDLTGGQGGRPDADKGVAGLTIHRGARLGCLRHGRAPCPP